MSAKKEVEFDNYLYLPEPGQMAVLLGVKGHYRLGDQSVVHTSYVVDVRDGGSIIETKNTIYKKVPTEGDDIEE